MKTFWSIIAVLTLATLAVWFTRPRAGAPTPTPSNASAPVVPVTPPPAPEPQPEPTPAPTSASTAAPTPNPAPAASPEIEPAPTPAATHNAYHTANTPPPAAAPEEITPKTDSAPETKTAGGAPTKSADATTTEPPADGAKFILGPATETKEEPDGWTRLDGRFLVRGKGTADDPLLLPWELLVSASETYRPRTGLKEMPRRVADLKGKHVKITGYALFPLLSSETTELLLMRNQWDGCCIGVPPTPYDAVEVKLAKPAERRDTFVTYVTLEGVLDVDPYVNRDFLLGLYTLSDGALVQPAKDKDAADKGL